MQLNSLRPAIRLLLLALLPLTASPTEINPSCREVPGIGPAVNIFHNFFQGFLRSMSPASAGSGVELVTYSEQNLESLVYRFIFKYKNTRGKLYYVGILSTIAEDQINEPNPEHLVVRFIQSSDIQDAQRLLGLYNVNGESASDCGFKQKFWDKVRSAPFETNLSGAANQPQQQLQPQIPDAALLPIANPQPLSQQKIAHFAQKSGASNTNSNNMVFKQQTSQSNADGAQAISDLLASLTGNKVNASNTVTNYQIITTSNSQNDSDALKSLLTQAGPMNAITIPINLPAGAMAQPYQVFTTAAVNGSQVANSQPIVIPFGGAGDGGNMQAMLNQIQIKQLEGAGGTQSGGGTRYNNQTRYILGSVLSGTGRDKIMNPTVVSEGTVS